LKIVKDTDLKIPFILVTATVSEEFAVTIIKEGAEDYVLKDRLQRLPSAVLNAIKKKQLELEREKYFTEIVASREELKAAHERLLFHIENSPLGFVEWDNNAMVKSWSKRAEEIFGWTEKELIENNKPGFSQVHEEDLPSVRKMIKELTDGTVERKSMQYRSYTKNGKVIWCEWFNSILKDTDGKVITIMSLVQDITKNKKAEGKLKTSEKRFREIFENSPEAIIVLDVQTKLFSRYNTNALKLLKYSPEELLKKDLAGISPALQPEGQNSEEKLQMYINAAINGEKPAFEWTLYDSKQKELICDVRLVKLSGVDSNHILASIVDITERKNAETMREKITADLILRNKDLEQFAYIVSHNLRAPLTNIMGLSAMLENASLEKEARNEVLNNLTISANKLDGIIIDLNQILNLRSNIH
jgi:PAS domain S-box-containing protein